MMIERNNVKITDFKYCPFCSQELPEDIFNQVKDLNDLFNHCVGLLIVELQVMGEGLNPNGPRFL